MLSLKIDIYDDFFFKNTFITKKSISRDTSVSRDMLNIIVSKNFFVAGKVHCYKTRQQNEELGRTDAVFKQ